MQQLLSDRKLRAMWSASVPMVFSGLCSGKSATTVLPAMLFQRKFQQALRILFHRILFVTGECCDYWIRWLLGYCKISLAQFQFIEDIVNTFVNMWNTLRWSDVFAVNFLPLLFSFLILVSFSVQNLRSLLVADKIISPSTQNKRWI